MGALAPATAASPRVTVRGVLAAAALIVAVGCSSPAAEPAATPSPPDVQSTGDARLLADLRDGGHILLLRHAATDRSRPEIDPADYRECSRQRLLSDEGRTQARDIGEAMSALDIPIGDVLASPYCRATETAELGFGRVRTTTDLLHLVAANDEAQRSRLVAALRTRLSAEPPPGRNTVLVTHNDNIQRATGLLVDEGELVVVRPRGEGFEVLATVAPEDWGASQPP